jgi:recombination protein RecT
MSSAPATTTSARDLKTVLEQAQDRMAKVLPKHLTPERMIQVVSTMAFKTPALRQCDPNSVLACVLQLSELGLELSPTLGEAYLIPRKGVCTFLPGYRGLVKLAMQSGDVLAVRSSLVRQGDLFSVAYDPDLVFQHVPSLDTEEREVTHVYAIARLKNGERLIEVMTRDEVNRIRSRSSAANDGPWKTDWNEMARKTVMRRLCKSLPRSYELNRAIEADEAEYQDGPRVVVSAAPLGASRTAALADRLALPQPEPTFTPTQGVDRPLYTEDEATQEVETVREREPGED